ncbi:hypothetical protein O9992_19875 [Vibrio lentus]|nr:hypothetical protein [Vibrio lentus]
MNQKLNIHSGVLSCVGVERGACCLVVLYHGVPEMIASFKLDDGTGAMDFVIGFCYLGSALCHR